MTIHRTFMDTTGRTVLQLTAVNLVDELRDRELLVSIGSFTLQECLC